MSELYHYGVLGMKWGVRRYQNKDGTLTSEGKRHVNNYRQNIANNEKAVRETNNLLRSNASLRKDFGGEDNWDDAEYVLYEAERRKLNTVLLEKSLADTRKFYNQNKKSIAIGAKIVKKFGNKIVTDRPASNKQSQPNLTDRFNKALKDNPDLTYDKIYKDMKVDMSSEDTSTYKEAEDAWLKRHGY